MLIEGQQQSAALFQCPETIESDGVQPLKDVTTFAMLRCPPMLLVEAQDVLKPCNNPLLAWGVAGLLRLRWSEVGEFSAKFVEAQVSHNGLPYHSA